MLGIVTRWKVEHIIRHWHNDEYMMDYIFFTNIYKVFLFLLPLYTSLTLFFCNKSLGNFSFQWPYLLIQCYCSILIVIDECILSKCLNFQYGIILLQYEFMKWFFQCSCYRENFLWLGVYHNRQSNRKNQALPNMQEK